MVQHHRQRPHPVSIAFRRCTVAASVAAQPAPTVETAIWEAAAVAPLRSRRPKWRRTRSECGKLFVCLCRYFFVFCVCALQNETRACVYSYFGWCLIIIPRRLITIKTVTPKPQQQTNKHKTHERRKQKKNNQITHEYTRVNVLSTLWRKIRLRHEKEIETGASEKERVFSP